MFDWNDMRHFIALAEAGTLSGAARKMKVDHATVARHIAALEQALGERLVDRLARRWQLTETGCEVARAAEGMLAQAHALERMVRARKTTARARVTVSAPPAFASAFLAPRIAELGLLHPELDLVVSGNQSFISLGRQEADIAVRLSRPTEMTSVARRVGSMPFALYAAPGYTERPPEAWQFIAYDSPLDHVPEQEWLYRFADGRQIRFRSNDLTSQLAAVRIGLGIAVLPCFFADADRDVMALSAQGGLSRDIYLVAHTDMRRNTAIRVVMDFIAAKLAHDFVSHE